jgi:hypothetical protein
MVSSSIEMRRFCATSPAWPLAAPGSPSAASSARESIAITRPF